jgi:hypothetical protein
VQDLQEAIRMIRKRPKFPSEASGEVLLEVSTYFFGGHLLRVAKRLWKSRS